MQCQQKFRSLSSKFFTLSLSLLLFFGCSNNSIFTGLDHPDTEKIATYSGEKLLASLEVNIHSPAFYRVLTVVQREKILSTLNSMIAKEEEVLAEGTSSRILAQSTKAAVELLIYSDPLVYDMIYNFADPALSALTLSGTTMDDLYQVYTDSITKLLRHGVENALDAMALAFYNLYRISNYYNKAVDSSPYGMYSGGDLQTYLLSGIIGGLVSSVQKIAKALYLDFQTISKELSDAYYRLINENTFDEDVVNQLFEYLAQELETPMESIISAYKAELDFIAEIFEAMANNAGYNLLAKNTASTIKSWGN